MAIKELLILDAGHAEKVSGKRSPDNGATLMEWEFNNDMQYRIKKRVEEHGIHVFLTNPSPKGVNEIGLQTRCNKANDYWKKQGKPRAMFVSLHGNAAGGGWSSASGTETFIPHNADADSKAFAKLINDQIVADLKTRNRGVKTENFSVIYNTMCSAVLVEYGFYSNKEEALMLKNKRNELTEASVKAICKHFGKSYKAPNSTSKPPVQQPSAPSKFVIGEYNKPVKVTTDNLNVRVGRGTEHKVLGQLNKGDVVTVWGIDKDIKGDLWGAFRYNPEYIAYVHMGYVEPTASTPPPVSTPKPIKEGQYDSNVKVDVDSLNVRNGRGTNHKVIGKLTKGKVIEVWSIAKGDNGKLWGSFRYDSNNVGFISMDCVVPA